MTCLLFVYLAVNILKRGMIVWFAVTPHELHSDWTEFPPFVREVVSYLARVILVCIWFS